jgi:hypothetical protein
MGPLFCPLLRPSALLRPQHHKQLHIALSPSHPRIHHAAPLTYKARPSHYCCAVENQHFTFVKFMGAVIGVVLVGLGVNFLDPSKLPKIAPQPQASAQAQTVPRPAQPSQSNDIELYALWGGGELSSTKNIRWVIGAARGSGNIPAPNLIPIYRTKNRKSPFYGVDFPAWSISRPDEGQPAGITIEGRQGDIVSCQIVVKGRVESIQAFKPTRARCSIRGAPYP